MLSEWIERGRESLQRLIQGRSTSTRTLRGIPVVVVNSRPDIGTEAVFTRIDGALALIERYQPWIFRHMRRDFARILSARYPCRGAYIPSERTCLVELTFTVNPEFTLAQVASTILHEAMHARIDRCGVRTEALSRAREERFCRRAEVEFGQMVPDGTAVVERALASLAAADEEVAPAIDWALASRRVAAADLAAVQAPAWVKRALTDHSRGST